MNVLTDTWRGLVRRRLWPVAVVLIAALVAVPKLLAKSPTAPPPAPVTAPLTKSSDDSAATTALVSATDDPQGKRRRYVLGRPKDPFEPAPLPKAKHRKKAAAAKTAKATTTSTVGDDSSNSGGSSSGGGSDTTPPASTPPAATTPAKPSYPANSLKINFGLTSAPALTKRTLQVRQALPSAGHPVLVYMGLEDHGKTAVFMVGSDVKSLEGDASCVSDCTTLRLKAGDTEFINTNPTSANPKGDQYELDLLQIHASAKAKAAKSTMAAKTAANPAWAARRAPRPKVHF
jgi:hypothetical protein